MRTLKEFVKQKLVAVVETAMTNVMTRRTAIDYEKVAFLLAARETADFFLRSMRLVPNLVTRPALLEHAVRSVALDGLWLEFGVYKGRDLRTIAGWTRSQVFGFDSFEGLPEDWTNFARRGRFSLEGRPPDDLPKNVTLVPGLFDQTLPPFLEEHGGPVAFLHMDCDLYSSTRTVLRHLGHRIVSDTVILFDDFLNYPGWQEGEFKAFMELSREPGMGYEFIGFASSHHSVAVRMKREA